MRSLGLKAPAKVNFGLRVCGLRADGYHELESLFLPLDLADQIELIMEPITEPGSPGDPTTGAPTIHFELDGAAGGISSEDVPTDQTNLAVRAAHAFFEEAGRGPARLDIHLRKLLPTGAGLGGGSSDAAAVLRGLAEMYPTAHSTAQLGELALSLGADVPFFLNPKPAWISGIGEVITPVSGMPSFTLLLLNPGTSLSTPRVFRRYDEGGHALTLWEPGSTMRAIFEFQQGPQGEKLQQLLANDLESAARDLCPAIASMRAQLMACGADAVAMSGSGATMFGVFEGLEAAQAARSELDLPQGSWARVARTLPSERPWLESPGVG